MNPKVFDVFVKWLNTGCPDWTNIEEAENGAWMDPETGNLLLRPQEDMPKIHRNCGGYMFMIIEVPGRWKRPPDCRMCQTFSVNWIDDDLQHEPASYDVPILRLEALIALQLHQELYHMAPQLSTIEQAYDSLSPTSAFCQYLVQQFTYIWRASKLKCNKEHRWSETLSTHLPRAFMFSVMA